MGFIFIGVYILCTGLATFFLKLELLKHIDVYKMLILSGLSITVTGTVITLIIDHSLSFTKNELVAGAVYGLLHTIGLLGFFLALARLDVGIAVAIGISYVVFAAILSWLFLHEPMTIFKVIAITMIVGGSVMLALHPR